MELSKGGIISGLRCCYDTTGELDCDSMCPFVNSEGCRIKLHEAAENCIESLAAEVERLKTLVQPIGRNPCDGCERGWGMIGTNGEKAYSKSCMEDCLMLKEYLKKQNLETECTEKQEIYGTGGGVMTRGDYVRKMSDEDLAAWLLRSQNLWLMFFAEKTGMEKEITPSDDASDILAWLREPYLEGGK